jgi:hypothetical protein
MTRAPLTPYLFMSLIMLASGCATVGPAATPYETPTPSQPQATPNPPANPNPPASVNLQGFPLEYRQGYADGCASASSRERKDAARFKSDGQYRTGWIDGNALCKRP